MPSLTLAAGLLVVPAVCPAQSGRVDYELPPIRYSSSKPDDAIARLLKRISAKEVGFSGSDIQILEAVLKELKVPVESQIVVFSKTSMQRELISPRNPRALYFSDSVYVGWMPGGLIELAAIDPELGPVYYALDPQDARDGRRTFVRERSCLACHGREDGEEIPSLLARSILATRDGEILSGQDQQAMDDSMPFSQRWGGWYVTGYTGATHHRGNAFAEEGSVDLVPSGGRPKDLSGFFDTSKYLKPTSEMAALLVFQHQVAMHDVLTRASHRARRALMNSGDSLDEATRSVLINEARNVVAHLLFKDAAPLPEGIEINDEFRRSFAADTPRDGEGNSLKDFPGIGHLFKNRCSFLIYSESVTALPVQLKSLVFKELQAALAGDAQEGNHLEPEERLRIVKILKETLPEAREVFR